MSELSDRVIEIIQKYGTLQKTSKSIGLSDTVLYSVLQHGTAPQKTVEIINNHYETYNIQEMPKYSAPVKPNHNYYLKSQALMDRCQMLTKIAFDFCGSFEDLGDQTVIKPVLLRKMYRGGNSKQRNTGFFLSMCKIEKYLKDNNIKFPPREMMN